MSGAQGFANSGYVPPGQPPQHGYPPQQGYPPAQQSYPPVQQEYNPQQGYPPVQQGPPAQPSSGKAPWTPSEGFQFQGEVPDQDVDEDPNAQEGGPSAPPPIDATVPGYEGVAYATEAPAGPPPSYTDAIQETTIDSTKMPTITAEEAREALLEYVSQQCCYGRGAAEDMSIKDLKSSSALHYSLETYSEGRSTKWCHVPYSGGPVDGPHFGPAPGPWDIPCGYMEAFKGQVVQLEVPHTASVRGCHVCFSRGFERCWRCFGRGKIRCSFCHGSGRRTEFRDGQHVHTSCHSCNGSGRKRCYTCHGFGCIQCRECSGFGQLKQFIQLTVTFTNRVTDHVVERTDMPDDLIKDAEGDMILEQVDIRVGAVVGFIENEINERSQVIVQTHATSWPTERILQQRQKLRAVPVYECDFKFNDKKGRFWVYGKQRLVYTTDYPHTCCCCNCVIL